MTEICQISDACSSSKFEFKIFSFKCFVVSNYLAVKLVVKLQLYIVTNSQFKEKEILSLSGKYKVAKPLKVDKKIKYGVPRNTISTWLLPGNKEKIEVRVNFKLVRLVQKGKP